MHTNNRILRVLRIIIGIMIIPVVVIVILYASGWFNKEKTYATGTYPETRVNASEDKLKENNWTALIECYTGYHTDVWVYTKDMEGTLKIEIRDATEQWINRDKMAPSIEQDKATLLEEIEISEDSMIELDISKYPHDKACYMICVVCTEGEGTYWIYNEYKRANWRYFFPINGR